MLRYVVIFTAVLGSAMVSADEVVDFNFDIKPILSDRCYICHGPDEENREAELRLDTQSGAFIESQTGNVDQVIQPGNHEASELFLRIVSDDESMLMPPPESNLSLSKQEIDLIRRWIDQGAQWKDHWAFLPIKGKTEKTAATHQLRPETIDQFIDAQLDQADFSRAKPATRETLIRRLSFDITGLPPTVAETDAFLADQSPTAYEDLVDRLLGSERYGERMASIWLDIARYSDTYGFQVDRERFVWPYRDWVVRHFNNNLPYDQFITEQLAGDLLPSPTRDQILATTFGRLHPQKVEGGSVPEEFRIEYVADRAQTVATSMLGLTFECARCHDHKYDPISQKEYYQLTAFFDKIDEAGLYSYFTPSVPTPTLSLGDAAFEEKRKQLVAKVNAAHQQVQAIRAQQQLQTAGNKPAARTMPAPIEQLTFDDGKVAGQNQAVPGVAGKAIKLSGDDAVKLKQGNFKRYQPFSASLWVQVPERRERAVIFHRSRAWTDAGSRGYECMIKDGHLTASLVHFWPGNAISIRMDEEFPLQSWHHIAMTYDGSSNANGLRLYVDGKLAQTSVVRDNLYKQIAGGGNDFVTIGERFRDQGFKAGIVDEFKLFDVELHPQHIQMLATDSADNNDAGKPSNSETKADEKIHQAYREKLAALQAVRKELCELQDGVQEIMVMRKAKSPRETYVLERGDYTARGEKVEPTTLAALPPMDETAPRDRLGFARWLTDPAHPLTARVAANRLWQIIFGTGLVRTPEDFGSQGQLPTHPQLLDWLARDYIDHGWDTKRFVKQLVMSQTYRQSSVATADLLETDPENRLYGRFPSYRLPAEMLRDQSLQSSELLVEKVGGAPVKPYDLQFAFKPIKVDQGESLYRRSLYTYWQRTGPSPSMMALDAAKRDVCRVQRSRTSSPLQTLVLMNSPQFVEASRAMASAVIQQHGSQPERLTEIFRRLTGRKPTDPEMDVLRRLHARQLQHFSENSADALAYLKVGANRVPADTQTHELAALAGVVNALFGFDEVMMKR